MSTGQDFLGYNMFAYCGNNPVGRTDTSGQIWNVVGGAVVGALIGVASKALCNVIDRKPVTDGLTQAALTGAAGGALTAMFPGASTIISVGMSATESIISDVQRGENLPTIIADATLAAGFAAITSGGTVFSDKNIVKNSVNAITKLFPGNHPSVKNAARTFIKETGKAVWNEIITGIADGLAVNYANEATKWFVGLYTGSNTTYEAFAG